MGIESLILADHERDARHDWLRTIFSRKAVYRVQPGSPPLLGKAPGERYQWQIYSRRATLDPVFADRMATLALDLIARRIGHFDFQLAGLETASVPVMCALSSKAMSHGISLNVIAVRKNRKDYGLHNWIEGESNGKPILLVDDLCNSTSSLGTALHVLSAEYNAGFIPHTFTLVNKCPKGGVNESYDKHMPNGFEALYLLDLTDIGLMTRGTNGI